MAPRLPNVSNLKIPYITAILILLPLVIYFFSIVPAKRGYYEERNFRILHDMSGQIQSRIENLATVLEGAAQAGIRRVEVDAGLSAERARVVADSTIRAALDLAKDIEIIGTPSIGFDNVARKEGALHDDRFIQGDSVNFSVAAHLRREQGAFWLHLDFAATKRDPIGERSGGLKRINIETKSNLSRIISPIVSREALDDVIIAQTDGNIIYQREKRGLKAARFGRFSGADGKEIPFPSLTGASGLLDVQIGGKDYKLFIQPIQLSFLVSAHEGDPTQANHPEMTAAAQYVEWVLCGMVSAARFESESKAISYTLLIAFSLVAMLVIFSWPLLKLIYMGPSDRLRVGDVSFLGLTAIVGTGILTFVLMDTYYYRDFEKKMNSQLREFAFALSENFVTEIREAISVLNSLPDRSRIESPKTNILADTSLTRKLEPYPFLSMAFWIDREGLQIGKWTVKKKTTPLISVATRSYFQEAKNGNLWSLGDSLKFRMEPIYSWTTGENEVILTVSDTLQVGEKNRSVVSALAFRPMSLIGPAIPNGLGFCVINQNGDVLFHSDERRNLRENFFRECDNDPGLRSAIFAEASEFIRAQYLGRDHQLYAMPLPTGPPWYLIAFQDMEQVRTANLETMTIAMLLFVLYVLVFLIFLAFYLAFRRKLSLNWLWPNRVYSRAYLQIASVCLAAGSLYTCRLIIGASQDVILQPFIYTFYALLLTYLRLRGPFVLTDWRYVFPHVLLVLLILSGPISLFWQQASTLPAWFILLESIALAVMALLFLSPQMRKFLRIPRLNSFESAYLIAQVSLLFLLAILPAIGFFKAGYEQEARLLVRNQQLKFARSLQDRLTKIEAAYRSVAIPDKSFVRKRLQPVWWDIYPPRLVATTDVEIIFETVAHKICPMTTPVEDRGFRKRLMVLRLLYNETAIETNKLFSDAVAGSRWAWAARIDSSDRTHAGGIKRSLVKTNKLLYHGEMRSGDAVIHLATTVPGFPFPGIPWWVGLCGLLAIVFLLMRFIAHRVFLMDLDVPLSLAFLDFKAGKVPHNVLLIGSPSSGKSRLLKDQHFHLIDLVRQSEEEGWAARFDYAELPAMTIGVDHFEHKIEDVEMNRQKLLFLEQLVFKHRKRVVLVSNTDPMSILDEYDDEQKKLPIDPGDRNRWAGVFSSFLRVYVQDEGDYQAFSEIVAKFKEQLHADKPEDARIAPKEQRRILELFRVLVDECGVSYHLQTIGKDLANQQGFLKLTPQQLVNQILDWAESYYRSLWESATREEKRVLVHLAKDGLVNSKNTPVITALLRRHILIQTPALRVMNESFRKFLLTIHDPVELANWERHGARSSWKILRGPLIVVILTVVVFLSVTQQDLFKSTLTLISGMTVLIPALIKLFGLFQERTEAARAGS